MDVIYARQSIDKKDSISIETQIELCKREVESPEGYKVFSDKGYSGKNLSRPDFQRLLEEVRAGGVERVIVYRIDRVSRSLLDFMNLFELFQRHGAAFVSTQEKFDTSTPLGKAMIRIIMIFAELERETIQQRIRDNYYSRGKKGMYLGGPPPYGYVKTAKALSEHPKEILAVERAFALYGDRGMSLSEIAKQFNAEGVPTKRGVKWDNSKISVLLRNPVYVRADADVCAYYQAKGCQVENDVREFVDGRGCYLYGKRDKNARKFTDVTDHHLSLAPHKGAVDADLFLRCQRRLDRNVQIDNRSWGKNTYLTGLVKCAICGGAASPRSQRGGKYYYFYCRQKERGACAQAANLGDVRAVEAVVGERIKRWAAAYRDLQAIKIRADDHKAQALSAQIADAERRIDNLLALASDTGGVSASYIRNKIAELDALKQSLRRDLLAVRADAPAEYRARISDLTDAWDGLSVSMKHEIALTLIDRIRLSCGEAVIEWKYDFACMHS